MTQATTNPTTRDRRETRKRRALRPLNQMTWLGTIHAYIDAARRELNRDGRKTLYRDLRGLLGRLEADEDRHAARHGDEQ